MNSNSVNIKKNLSKYIIKSHNALKQYSKNNKFSYKKNNNFIHFYLLYIQNKYNLDFGLKGYTKETKFSKILRNLYKKNSDQKNIKLLFNKSDILGELFFKSENFKLERYLLKLEEQLSSINYVNSNIQILDYLGNTNNDVQIISCAFCLILLKEYFPEIKIAKSLTNTIYENLLKSINNGIKYTNTQSLLCLILLKKYKLIDNFDSLIQKIINLQLPNGSFPNGYNSYLVINANELNILHTCFVLIILLEYKTIYSIDKIKEKNKPKDVKTKGTIEKSNKPKDVKTKGTKLKSNKNNIAFDLTEKEKKQKEDIKETIEGFENIINTNQQQSYYFDLNFHNTVAILIIILILMNLNKIKKILKI